MEPQISPITQIKKAGDAATSMHNLMGIIEISPSKNGVEAVAITGTT